MLPYIEFDGRQIPLGNLVSDGVPRAYGFRYVGDSRTVPILSDRPPIDLSEHLPPVYDQDGIGACNAFSTVTVAEAVRSIQGLPYVRLSTGHLYGKINRQVDQGSLLEDALAEMMNRGVCKASTVGELDWRERNWPRGIDAEAMQYRCPEAFKCPSGRDLIPAMESCLTQGFLLNAGSLWYQSYTPGRDGKIPKTKRGGGGGHAYCLYGFERDTDGTWFLMRNSWGSRWGINGNAKIHESAFDSTIGGIFALRASLITR